MTIKYCEVHMNIKPYHLVPASIISEGDPPFKLCRECYRKYMMKYEHLLDIKEKIRV